MPTPGMQPARFSFEIDRGRLPPNVVLVGSRCNASNGRPYETLRLLNERTWLGRWGNGCSVYAVDRAEWERWVATVALDERGETPPAFDTDLEIARATIFTRCNVDLRLVTRVPEGANANVERRFRVAAFTPGATCELEEIAESAGAPDTGLEGDGATAKSPPPGHRQAFAGALLVAIGITAAAVLARGRRTRMP